jgi:hypothetical protein
MNRFLLLLLLACLASCESLREWAASVAPAPSPVGGGGEAVPPGDPSFDLVDAVVVALVAMGLLPAARLVAAGKPAIAAGMRRVLGPPTAKPAPASPSSPS